MSSHEDGNPGAQWQGEFSRDEAHHAAGEILRLIDAGAITEGGAGLPDSRRRACLEELIRLAIHRAEERSLAAHDHRGCMPRPVASGIRLACTSIARSGTMLFDGPHAPPAYLTQEERWSQFSRALYEVAVREFERYERVREKVARDRRSQWVRFLLRPFRGLVLRRRLRCGRRLRVGRAS